MDNDEAILEQLIVTIAYARILASRIADERVAEIDEQLSTMMEQTMAMRKAKTPKTGWINDP